MDTQFPFQFALLKIQETGMTQVEISEEIECAQSTVSDLIAGKIGVARPSYRLVRAVEKLAKRLGIDIWQDKPKATRKRLTKTPIKPNQGEQKK